MGRIVGIVLLALVAVASCAVDVNFGDSAFLCRSDPMVCQDGFECRGGRCVPLGTPFDAGTIDSPVVADAGPPVIPNFGAPTLVTELSLAGSRNDDASFSADRLVVVLNSNRGGGSDLWTSTRQSIDDPWPEPTRVTELSTTDAESTVALSADGLSILFGSDRTAPPDVDLFLATRPSRSEAWSTPQSLTALNTAAVDGASWIADDRRTLLFHTNIGGDFDLFSAELDLETGDYGNVTPLAEINTSADELSGRFSRGGLVFTIHSDRPGGLGNDDLYVAKRATTSEPFSDPVLISGVNSPNLEEDAWLSDDSCFLSFSTVDGDGDPQIFEARCIP